MNAYNHLYKYLYMDLNKDRSYYFKSCKKLIVRVSVLEFPLFNHKYASSKL